MEPIDGAGPFDDPEYRFEPWWPGLRVLVRVADGAVRLAAPDLSDPLTSFPELRTVGGLVTGGAAVLEATLLVLDGAGRPEPDLLRERLAYPEVHDGSVALVLTDLLWADSREVAQQPLVERLDQLGGLLQESDWCMVGRGFVGEGSAVAAALESMGLPLMSARHLDSPYHPGPSLGAWLRLPLRSIEPDPDRRPTLALLQRLGL